MDTGSGEDHTGSGFSSGLEGFWVPGTNSGLGAFFLPGAALAYDGGDGDGEDAEIVGTASQEEKF